MSTSDALKSLKQSYSEKCRDFLCEPVAVFLTAIQTALDSGEPLTELNLNGNDKKLFHKRVEYMQVFALSEALHSDSMIMKLDLSYNFIDDAGAQTIARMLKFNKALLSLRLVGNEIGPTGAAKLVEPFVEGAADTASDKSHLAMLDLSGNPIGEGGGLEIAKLLEIEGSNLRELRLSDCEVGTKAVVALCVALCLPHSALKALVLENPRLFSLQEETTLHVAHMLAQNSTLEALNLGKHKMRDHGIETLVAYGLSRNTTLQSLGLRCNELSKEAGSSLDRLLRECPTITDLDLASNRLQTVGVEGFADALAGNQTLATLDLRSNSIDDIGLEALAGALHKNRGITSLKLWGNAFGPPSAAAFDKALPARGAGFMADFRTYTVDGAAMVACM